MSESDSEPIVPPKIRRSKKSEAGTRKVQHSWTHKEILLLISAVEKRPALWDASSPAYKLSKLDSWREIVDDLGIAIDVKEVKAKWNALRVTFRVNLVKRRMKKSGQGAASSTVPWQYFKPMMFLEANDVRQSKSSKSTMDLPSAIDDDANLIDFNVSPNHQKRHKRRSDLETQPPSSAPPSSVFLNSAVSAMNSSDKNSTFSDYLTAHLRALPEHQADRLRNKLNRTLLDFLDAIESDRPQLTPLHIVDVNGLQRNENEIIKEENMSNY